MQQIYMQSSGHFEVFTTVFSPQVCRSRSRRRHTEVEKMVVAVNYRPHWPDELELRHGDIVHVLFKDDESWLFGRRQNGQEGYFPATYVTKLREKDDTVEVTPRLINRGSAQAMPAEVLGACESPPPPSPPTPPSSVELKSPKSRKESMHPSDGPAHCYAGLLNRILPRSQRRSQCLLDLNGNINGAFESD